MPIIPHIISQHAEEAAMLWILRHSAVDAPHYDLADLAKLDGRVDAHLDGLRISGGSGWELCLAAIQSLATTMKSDLKPLVATIAMSGWLESLQNIAAKLNSLR